MIIEEKRKQVLRIKLNDDIQDTEKLMQESIDNKDYAIAGMYQNEIRILKGVLTHINMIDDYSEALLDEWIHESNDLADNCKVAKEK